MPTPLPHRYDASLRWTGAGRAEIQAGKRTPIQGGPPPEFDGPDDVWSPEHLLLSSVNLCLMASFMAISKNAKLEVLGYDSRVTGVLEKTENGIVFTSMTAGVSCTVNEADIPKARKLLDSAKRHCIVSNSVHFPVHLDADVHAPRA